VNRVPLYHGFIARQPHRAVAAALAGVTLVHYDRDYERIAAVTDLDHRWFVADGALTA
jgi:predicted nucleic acid-binding protein